MNEDFLMTDEQRLDLAEEYGFEQTDFGKWQATEDELLELIFMIEMRTANYFGKGLE